MKTNVVREYLSETAKIKCAPKSNYSCKQTQVQTFLVIVCTDTNKIPVMEFIILKPVHALPRIWSEVSMFDHNADVAIDVRTSDRTQLFRMSITCHILHLAKLVYCWLNCSNWNCESNSGMLCDPITTSSQHSSIVFFHQLLGMFVMSRVYWLCEQSYALFFMPFSSYASLKSCPCALILE